MPRAAWSRAVAEPVLPGAALRPRAAHSPSQVKEPPASPARERSRRYRPASRDRSRETLGAIGLGAAWAAGAGGTAIAAGAAGSGCGAVGPAVLTTTRGR